MTVEKPRKREDCTDHDYDRCLCGTPEWNTCHTQWLAYHKQVLEGLKYEISTNKASMAVKNNWLREFNAHIDQALKDLEDTK